MAIRKGASAHTLQNVTEPQTRLESLRKLNTIGILPNTKEEISRLLIEADRGSTKALQAEEKRLEEEKR